ncbi:MAG: hypothetical protein NW223_04490 [Hyphomicrobiaceae bacterium]|nr:hypothetical protein [Hyphomicrobiaceae bacterium]
MSDASDPVPVRRTLLGGKLVYANKTCVRDCTVRQLSPDGAVISLPSTLGLPRVLELRIPSLAAAYVCETTSRTLSEMRLSFVR